MYRTMIAMVLSFSMSMAKDSFHPSLEGLRVLYSRAAISEDTCRTLIKTLGSYTVKNEPLLAGYRGAATMIMARHAFNPVTKLRHFRQGRALLEEAIAEAPHDAELRYLRYSIQTNCPSFLGYKDNLQDDRQLLLAYAREGEDNELKHMISAYLR